MSIEAQRRKKAFAQLSKMLGNDIFAMQALEAMARSQVNPVGLGKNALLPHFNAQGRRTQNRMRVILDQMASKMAGRQTRGVRATERIASRIGSPRGNALSPKGQARRTAYDYLRNLADQFQRAQDEARAANEERYQQLLSGYNERYRRGMAGIARLGKQGMADIRQAFGERAGDVRQELIGRGLIGSSALPTMLSGVAREESNAIARLNEQLMQQRLQADAGLSGDLLRVIEARNDVGPDYGQMIQLAGLIGQSGRLNNAGRVAPRVGGGGGVMLPPVFGNFGFFGPQRVYGVAVAAARQALRDAGKFVIENQFRPRMNA